MSKAIMGAVELAGAAFLLLTPGLNVLASPFLIGLMVSLAAGGLSMEAAAVAEMLTANRGQNITTRQAAGLRQIIYGQQRVGGTVVYQSTTGAGGSGGNYVYNYVIALASHLCDGIVNIYLDGRQVFFRQSANPSGYHANVGCGSIPDNAPYSEPPTTTATVSGGAITGITATGGYGLANVPPQDGYRVRIYDPTGAGSGAVAWATLAGGSGFLSTAGPNNGSAVGGTWTVTIENPGSGYSNETVAEVQGFYTFGGTAAADSQDPSQVNFGLGYGIGPGGPHYNFDGKVYCEVRFGDQPAGDYMKSLSDNDTTWPSTANLGGITYIYLNVGYETTQFPAAPEIRVTMTGKDDIFDPRTGKTGYSTNWALQVADVFTDPVWGLGDNSVNTDQLIAAANVCDEQIETSQGLTSNYTQHIHYDASTAPGDALNMMMSSAAGRLSRVGGEWYIYPAYYQTPSFTFDNSALVGNLQSWKPRRKRSELINCVNGTYVAPNYPYSAATGIGTSNLYDSNGWFYGETENTWNMAWQPDSFPQYAADALHGYSGNAFLVADGGTVLPMELTLRGVIDIVQAQRVAKINLMRNRQEGSATFPMSLAGWQMQPLDVMEFTFPTMGWSEKLFEVSKIQLVVEPVTGESGEDGAMAISTVISVQETDPSVYEWSESEELTAYDVPAIAQQLPYQPAAPTALTLSNDPLTGADGIVTPSILVSWTAPADNTVTYINVEHKLHSSSSWISDGLVGADVTSHNILGIVAGSSYDVRVASVRNSNIASGWVQQSSFGATAGASSLAAAQVTSGTFATSLLPASGVTPGSYTTANITVDEYGRITAASNG